MLWTAVAFATYLLVLGLLAIVAARTAGDSEEEFYLAGRSLGAWVVALSAVASGRSAWLLLGMTWLAFQVGVAAVWFLPGYIVAELLLFVGPGRRLRRFTGEAGDVTVGDFFASRFPRWAGPLRGVFTLVVLVFLTTYISGQLVAGAKGMGHTFHLDRSTALAFTAAVVLLYVVAGGFRAVSWTDVAQVGLMFLALVVLPLLAVLEAGGFGGVLDKLEAAGKLSPLSQGWPYVLTGLAVGFGSPGNPHILVRYMSVDDERKLSRAAVVGTAWNVVMGWGALWVGLAGQFLLDGSPGAELAFPSLAAKVLPPVLYGLVMAALLAAIMSTVDSQVLVVASAITRDLRRLLGLAPLSRKGAAWAGRITSTILIAGAAVLAQGLLADPGEGGGGAIQGLVNKLVLFAWGGLGASFGPALLLALYDRRARGLGAFAAMVTGGVVACTWRAVVRPLLLGWREAEWVTAPSWIRDVGPYLEYELTVAFPLALLVGWVCNRIPGTRPEPED